MLLHKVVNLEVGSLFFYNVSIAQCKNGNQSGVNIALSEFRVYSSKKNHI